MCVDVNIRHQGFSPELGAFLHLVWTGHISLDFKQVPTEQDKSETFEVSSLFEITSKSVCFPFLTNGGVALAGAIFMPPS